MTAFKLRQERVSMKLPDLLQVSKYQISFQGGQFDLTELHLISIARKNNLQIIHVVHLSVKQLFDDIFSSKSHGL